MTRTSRKQSLLLGSTLVRNYLDRIIKPDHQYTIRHMVKHIPRGISICRNTWFGKCLKPQNSQTCRMYQNAAWGVTMFCLVNRWQLEVLQRLDHKYSVIFVHAIASYPRVCSSDESDPQHDFFFYAVISVLRNWIHITEACGEWTTIHKVRYLDKVLKSSGANKAGEC